MFSVPSTLLPTNVCTVTLFSASPNPDTSKLLSFILAQILVQPFPAPFVINSVKSRLKIYPYIQISKLLEDIGSFEITKEFFEL